MISPLPATVSGHPASTGNSAKDLTHVRNGLHQRLYWTAMLFIVTLFLAGESIAQPLALKHGFSLGYKALINQVVVDGAGNSYVLGSFTDTVDFDPGPGETALSSAGEDNIFLAKYAPNGALIWVNRFGNTFIDRAYTIILDENGQVYITGSFKGTVDYDPSPNTANLTSEAGSTDIFMARYTPEGAYVWAKRLGGVQDYEAVSALAIDGAGHIYVTGIFGDSIDLDPGLGTAILTSATFAYDIFVAKYTTDGSYLWANRVGGAEPDIVHSMAVDAGGNVYITGIFQGTVDFDPGPATANLVSNENSYNLYMAKYTASGSYSWAKRMGGSSTVTPQSLVLDGSGNFYLTGSFVNTVDFDPGPGTTNLISAGYGDCFLAKYTAEGNLLWANRMGGIDTDKGTFVTVDASGNVYVMGNFTGTADFDPGPAVASLYSAGGQDIFVAKYTPTGSYVWATRFGGAGIPIGDINAYDRETSIAVDGAGQVYLTGFTNNLFDLNPGDGLVNVTGGFLGVFSVVPVSCGSPANTIGQPLVITGVSGVNCATGSLRILTSGGNGQAIDFSGNIGFKNSDAFNCVRVVDGNGLLSAINNPNSDIQPFLLKGKQNGGVITPAYLFDFKGYCTNVNPPAACGSPANTLGQPLEITGVSEVNCATGSFRILTSGGNDQAINFVGILGLSNINGFYCVRGVDGPDMLAAINNPASDIGPFGLKGTQNGGVTTPVFVFNFKQYCTGAPRLAKAESQLALDVRVLGNPTSGELVDIIVENTGGESVSLLVHTSNGQLVSTQTAQSAGNSARSIVRLGSTAGLFIVKVSTPTRTATAKALRQ